MDLRERQKNVISAGVLAAAVARDAFPSAQAQRHNCSASSLPRSKPVCPAGELLVLRWTDINRLKREVHRRGQTGTSGKLTT